MRDGESTLSDSELLAVILRSGTALLDWAFYDRNPTEGRVLARVAGTNKLA